MKTKKTQFGFQTISKTDKAQKVGEVFDSVSRNYDLMNNLMSLGLHKVWKRIVIQTASLRPKAKILDIASGTADLACLFLSLIKILIYFILISIIQCLLKDKKNLSIKVK